MGDYDPSADPLTNIRRTLNDGIQRSQQAIVFLQRWTRRSADIAATLMQSGFNFNTNDLNVSKVNDTNKAHTPSQSQPVRKDTQAPEENNTSSAIATGLERSDRRLDAPTHGDNLLDIPTTATCIRLDTNPSNAFTNTNTPPTSQLHRLETKEESMNIVHNAGYCAPAAFGLLYAECLIQGKFTQFGNQDLYKPPLQLFLRYFSLYYALENTTINDVIDRLRTMHYHAIQWLLAPVFRLMLHTVLTVNVRAYSEDFFVSQDCFSQPQWMDMLKDTLTDALIIESKNKLLQANQNPDNTSNPDRVLLYSHYFTQDDLFVLSRLLRVELSIHQRCTASHDMLEHKASILAQSYSRHMDQTRFYQNHMPNRTTISLFHELFILDSKDGITGHIDILKRDELLARSAHRLRLYATAAVDIADQIEPMATIAHCNPALLLELLPTIVSYLPEPCPQSMATDNQLTRSKSSDSLVNHCDTSPSCLWGNSDPLTHSPTHESFAGHHHLDLYSNHHCGLPMIPAPGSSGQAVPDQPLKTSTTVNVNDMNNDGNTDNDSDDEITYYFNNDYPPAP